MVQPIDAGAAVIEPIQDAHAVAALEEHAGQMRADKARSTGDQHASLAVGGAVVATGEDRGIEQLAQCRPPRPVEIAAQHEALDAADRADADPRFLEPPAEGPYDIRTRRGHGGDHLAHVMMLREREGVLERPEDRHAVQDRSELGGIIVEEPHQLYPRCGAVGQLAAD